jgi:hypothetical protein
MLAVFLRYTDYMENDRSRSRCLVVPGQFPPTNDTAALLAYKQLRLLPLEYDACVLRTDHADPQLQQNLDADPCWKHFHVVNADRYDNVLFSIRNVDLFKGLRHMKRYVQTATAMYDHQRFLYTSSFPCYTTRVGVQLKARHPELLWIANFTDPINHSPYKYDQETYRAYSLPEKAAFNLYCRYYVVDEDEIAALEQADLLLFICEEQRDFMIGQYEKYVHRTARAELLEKSRIVPLNYVPEWETQMDPAPEPAAHDAFVLSHFGRVYGLRIIEEFLYALRMFRDLHPLQKLEVHQYDVFRPADAKLIHTLHLEDTVFLHDKIPYRECLQKMRDSDAVLLFDTILPEEEIQPYLPSKILEYSRLKKDVLAVTTDRSPAYRIMKKTDAIACRYSRSEILQGLEQLIIGHKPSRIDYSYTNREAVAGLEKWVREHL